MWYALIVLVVLLVIVLVYAVLLTLGLVHIGRMLLGKFFELIFGSRG